MGGINVTWEGNLDRMALALDATGNPALATVSSLAAVLAPVTANAMQANHAGSADVHLAVVHASGAMLRYGTFFGGSLSDRPKSIAVHPAGGFVIGGLTGSPDLPCTAGCFQSSPPGGLDGFLVWVDPARAGPNGRIYATYFGGSVGEDNVLALQCETSGVVTLAGYSTGGAIPLSPRSLQTVGGTGQVFGYLARLELRGLGASDLVYSTLVGLPSAGTSTRVLGLALDAVGDAWLAGSTNAMVYHLVNPYQATNAGGRDSILTHVPLLPGPAGCVGRSDVALATPCNPARPLYAGMALAPIVGTTFALTAANAPPASLGVLLIGTTANLPIFNARLLVVPAVSLGTGSSALGYARLDIPIPATLHPTVCWGLAAQWIFLTNAACAGNGPLAASERLDF